MVGVEMNVGVLLVGGDKLIDVFLGVVDKHDSGKLLVGV